MSKLHLSATIELPADVFEAARVVTTLDEKWKDFVSNITSRHELKHEVTAKVLEHRAASAGGNGAHEAAKRKRRTKAEMEAARVAHLAAAEEAKVF